MQFILMPSLEHIALVKAAVILWKEDKIRSSVAHFCSRALFHFEIRKEWKNVVKKVIINASTLDFPEILKKKLLTYIWGISEELLKWINDHEKYLYYPTLSKKILGEISWTSAGKIDKKETTKLFVREEDIATSKRFILACVSCFQEDVYELWNKLTTLEKEYFCSNNGYLFVQKYLVEYWTFTLNEHLPIQNIEFFMFVDSVTFCNIQAVKYFWSGFSSELERSILPILITFFESRSQHTMSGISLESGCSEVIPFLLPKMSPEEQIQLMKMFPNEILKCYLEWPLQSMFISISEVILPWMSDFQFSSLFFHIIHHISHKKLEDYNYQKLLGEFWQQSPITYKKYIIDTKSSYLFSNLMVTDDRCNIRLILQTSSMEDRDEILFKHLSILQDSIDKKKFDLLQFFILQCISSKERLVDFKLECDKYFKNLPVLVRMVNGREEKWQAFFKLIDNMIVDLEKDAEDIERNPPKRLCI